MATFGRRNVQVAFYQDTPSMALFYCEVDEDGNTVNLFINPLPLWDENCIRFPLVVALARKMLAIPVTSAQAERLFSKTGQSVTNRRSSLGTDNIELLLFVRTVWPVAESKSNEDRKTPANNGAEIICIEYGNR